MEGYIWILLKVIVSFLMTWAGLMSIAGIFQLPHKWNTGSLDPGMASLLVKINLHADLHMLISPPPPHYTCLWKKIFLVCVSGSPNLNIHFFSLYIDIASG